MEPEDIQMMPIPAEKRREVALGISVYSSPLLLFWLFYAM